MPYICVAGKTFLQSLQRNQTYTYIHKSMKKMATYIANVREDCRNCCVLKVSNSPAKIKRIFSEMLTAQVLVPTRCPLLAFHVVNPFLKPSLVS